MRGRRGAARFFALTLASTWAAWLPAALGGSRPNPVLFALGGVAPSFWGVVLTRRECDSAEWRDYWRRALDPRRVPLGWFLVVVLLYPSSWERASSSPPFGRARRLPSLIFGS
jgi:hypothetical protein